MNETTKPESLLSMQFVRDNYLIILIFLGGLCLRIYDLGTESIWYDEAISVGVAKLDLFEQVRWSLFRSDNNPPLFYEIMHFWVQIFGDSEFAARFPSAIFGSFSIIAIYAVGRSLFNKGTALIAALILATSVFHIEYSQEARAYSLLALMSLLSSYFYLKIISSQNKSYFIGYLISSSVLLYTHNYGAFIIVAQNIFFFTNCLKTRVIGELSLKKWLGSQCLLFLLYLPGLYLLWKHASKLLKGFWISEASLYDVLGYFKIYSGYYYLLILFFIFSVISIIALLISPKVRLKPTADYSSDLPLSDYNRLYFILLWLCLPILIPYLISLISTPILIYRYTIGGSVALYLLVASGIDRAGSRKVILFACALILILAYLNIERYFTVVGKYQWRETVNVIEENAGPGDYFLAYPPFEIMSGDYYLKRKDIILLPLTDNFVYSADIGNKNLWVVLSHHGFANLDRIEKILMNKYRLIDSKQFKRLNLYQFQKK